MENSKVRLSGGSYFRFRNRWPDCKSGNVSSGNTITAQQCWSDVRVERQPGEAISPQVIVLPHDKRYVAPLSGNCIAARNTRQFAIAAVPTLSAASQPDRLGATDLTGSSDLSGSIRIRNGTMEFLYFPSRESFHQVNQGSDN